MKRNLIVDGMLNGTGIRDLLDGGYIDLNILGISTKLIARIQEWLAKYEYEHYQGFIDIDLIQELDREGIEIAEMVKAELKDCKISYFSNANLTRYEI